MAEQCDTRRAFRWIVGVFRKHRVPFQITGGCAASLYGSPRTFNDIDILTRPAALPAILPDIKPYLTFGPGRYRDRYFDARMMTLNIYGTAIDVGMECRIRDHRTGRWHRMPGPTRFSRKRVFGLTVPVEAKDKLIKIKQILGRKKDLEDVAAMRVG